MNLHLQRLHLHLHHYLLHLSFDQQVLFGNLIEILTLIYSLPDLFHFSLTLLSIFALQLLTLV